MGPQYVDRIKAALDRLRASEWQSPTWGLGHCQTCEGSRRTGHKPDCVIGQTIQDLAGLLVDDRVPALVA
jgi:hypothetical protein